MYFCTVYCLFAGLSFCRCIIDNLSFVFSIILVKNLLRVLVLFFWYVFWGACTAKRKKKYFLRHETSLLIFLKLLTMKIEGRYDIFLYWHKNNTKWIPYTKIPQSLLLLLDRSSSINFLVLHSPTQRCINFLFTLKQKLTQQLCKNILIYGPFSTIFSFN